MLQIRCIRCGGPHLVWECPQPKRTEPENADKADEPVRFDKVAYMRAYMKKRRAQARREGKRVD